MAVGAISSTITIKSISDGRINIYKNDIGIGYVTGGADAQTFAFPNGGNYTIEAVSDTGYVFSKFCNAINTCVATNPIKGYINPTGDYLTYIGNFTASTTSSNIIIKSIANGRINIYKDGVGIGYVTGGADAQTFPFPNGGNYEIEAIPNSGYAFDKFCDASNTCKKTNPITGHINPTGDYLTYIGNFKLPLRLITIGDPHLSSDVNSAGYKNLTKAVNYINSRNDVYHDVDLTIVLGDIVNIDSAKAILDKLKTPYRVVAGNHDLPIIPLFKPYFGYPAAHSEDFNGFQLIFVGIGGTVDVPNWSFDYNTISDKTKPTIIFNHGPVQPGKNLSKTCASDWGSYNGYACNMTKETDKFTNLLAFYAGHVHTYTNQKIGNTLYVTEDNIGGDNETSLYIGYTVIKNGIVTYSRVKY
jgi:predicted phosphodiesterase